MTVAIVVYKGLIPVVDRILTANHGKPEQLKEVLYPVSGMLEAFCYEKGEHRKSDATEATHDLIKKCFVLHQVVGTVVYHHRDDGNDLQCATTQWRQMD